VHIRLKRHFFTLIKAAKHSTRRGRKELGPILHFKKYRGSLEKMDKNNQKYNLQGKKGRNGIWVQKR